MAGREPKTPHFRLANRRTVGDWLIFNVDFVDPFSRNTLYSIPAHYNIRTGKCGCSFLSHIEGLENKTYEGFKKRCDHYPNGDCEVIAEVVTDVILS